MRTFGRRLRELREERGISIEALASMAGISRKTLSRWESGKMRPRSYQSWQILADIFHVDPLYFAEERELRHHPVIDELLQRVAKLEKQVRPHGE